MLGQIVGEPKSFVSRLQEAGQLLANDDCILVPGVSVQIASRKVNEILRCQKVSRIVLQLGHRETIRASRLDLPWRRIKIEDKVASQKSPSEPFTILGYTRHLVMGIALSLLGFDRWAMAREHFERRLARDLCALMQVVCGVGVEEVIVLSCFPSAKKRLNDRRVVANRLLEEAAGRAGVTFVDAWKQLTFRSGPFRDFAKPSVLADAAHLSADGHGLVAEAISLAMRPVQTQTRSNESRFYEQVYFECLV